MSFAPSMGSPHDHGKTMDPSATLDKSLPPSEAPVAIQVELGSLLVIDAAAERRLVRKLDLRILPTLAIMYLCKSLDSSNLGNAKTNGLEKDLGLVGNQYNIMASMFYIPYVLFAPLISIAGKKYGPHRVLSACMMVFGSATLLVLAIQDFGGIMTLRWLVGMSESSFFPLVIYYQTTFWRRGELARRLSIFYAAQSIASAFGGLLAYGVFQLPSGMLSSWRYLFAIEGALTVLVAIFAMWYLPASASKASFLTPEEKQLARQRVEQDSSSSTDEAFDLRDSLKIFRYPFVYIVLAIEICVGIPLQAGLFFPQIIGRFGYSAVKTNLYTVAPNVSGSAVLLILCFASDYSQKRFPFIAAGFLLTFIGFMIYAAIDIDTQTRIGYFSCFVMTWGGSAPSVLLDVWYCNNIAHPGRRLVLTGVAVPLANLMGVVSANIFRSQDAPKYTPALATIAACGATGVILTLSLGFWMAFDNRRRDRKQGVKIDVRDVSTALLRDGPTSPHFRWTL